MASCLRGLWAALVLVTVVVSAVPSADASVPLIWSHKRRLAGCEPPNVFYSSHHKAGAIPCCATIEGVCSGGSACPVSGICPDNTACVAGPVTGRPNVILFISDDQGYCHYGDAGECRSTQTGTPLPAPVTPSLDLIAGYGTVFPIAHNTASWCFPSLASILTGRYQKDFGGHRKVDETGFTMIPNALRGLKTAPATTSDPYNDGNVVGGYCTMLAGKFVGALDQSAFDAVAKIGARRLGRNDCVAGPAGTPPRCGTDAVAPYVPFSSATNVGDVFSFLDMLVYLQPGSMPAQYAMQHFFVWYAPRIPHAPLRAPQPVTDYLFGGAGTFPRGGVMDLGQWCTGGGFCAPVVPAFDESNIGTDRDYYSNVWWTDDNIREIRRFLAAETAPHCVGTDGRSKFTLDTQTSCQGQGGTWTSGVLPDLERNTIFIYLSDNGWQLPHSKHELTENGYRTQLLVYDPRTLPSLPSWNPQLATAPAPQFDAAVAHAIDVLPTALGFALGTSGSQACPLSPDGVVCDGKDLGGHLSTTPGGPAAPETLRHALCGHQTKRVASPTRNRFLLTRPGSVGRCTKPTNPACTTSAECGAGQFCVGGFCAPDADGAGCSSNAQCSPGAACIGNKCRMAPACTGDSDCTALVGAGYVCGGKAEKWCRNAPDVSCSANADCPVCPTVGSSPIPCSRLCESRVLKLYVSPGAAAPVELSDLFLDPDEDGLHSGDPSKLVTQLSSLSGPYAGAIRRLNCCIDAWWPDIVSQSGTQCTSGNTCPADFACD
jgi:hypothetical protein